jgi:membrane associated rhomboid family serine protease
MMYWIFFVVYVFMGSITMALGREFYEWDLEEPGPISAGIFWPVALIGMLGFLLVGYVRQLYDEDSE